MNEYRDRPCYWAEKHKAMRTSFLLNSMHNLNTIIITGNFYTLEKMILKFSETNERRKNNWERFLANTKIFKTNTNKNRVQNYSYHWVCWVCFWTVIYFNIYIWKRWPQIHPSLVTVLQSQFLSPFVTLRTIQPWMKWSL